MALRAITPRRGKTIDVRVLEPLRPTPLMRTDAATYAGAVRAAMLDAMPGARDWHDWDNRRMRDARYGRRRGGEGRAVILCFCFNFHSCVEFGFQDAFGLRAFLKNVASGRNTLAKS